VLKVVEGETLDARIRCGPVALPEALRIACQIAEALEAAYEPLRASRHWPLLSRLLRLSSERPDRSRRSSV